MTFRICWIIGISLFAGAAFTQPYPSRDGKFSVDQVSGCAPFNVTVTIDPVFTCGACDVDLDGYQTAYTYQSTNQSQAFLYENPGTYWLKVLIGTSDTDSVEIEVLENQQPDFDIYTCGNNEVSVQISDANYDEYLIDYNDGSPVVTVNAGGSNNHLYPPSIPQTITVRGRNLNAADNCADSSKIVTPLMALPAPTITRLEVLDEGSVRLSFNGQANILYQLSIATNGSTTFQQVKTLYNATVDTVVNLRTDDNYYCFRLAAFDPCNGTIASSAIICTADLDLAVRNNAIDLRWTTATAGISSYQLTRIASDGAVLVANPTGSPYADLGVTCGMEYCYQLVANYPNGSQSISLSKCGTGFSTDIPPPIENITALVGDNSVVLEWQSDPDFIPAEFSLEKSADNRYTFLATTTQHAFADAAYAPGDASCYRIRYADICGNESPVSAEACPVILTANLLDDNSINLSWTPYAGWDQGVAGYVVEKYSEDGQLLQTFQVGNATSYVDATDDPDFQTFVYVVKVRAAEAGLGQAVSNRVAVLKDPNLFHPTAFTPNGDNLNDHFTVFGQYVSGFNMKIFNRWGELLFTTEDIATGWDGTFRGAEMPEGTYTFIAYITDRAGRTFKRSGSVLLLRKR